ncbi:MAG: PEP-CTERM sorting domain-containing protein [Negativicutes bacterium]|nr:PEP-CTERM sorting domain-containing protein [Negativicutes bacterium]
MKKILTLTALCLSAVVSIHAQGTVFFGNGNTTKISTNSVPTATVGTSTTAANGNYYYALFFSSTTTTVGGSSAAVIGANGSYVFNAGNSASWTLATALGGGQLLGVTTATAGRLQSTTADASSVTQIGNLAGGTAVSWVMVAWSASAGSTVADMEAWYNNGQPTTIGWLGESVVSAPIALGILNSTATASIWGTGTGFLNGFTIGQVNPVPEPGTLALAALGGASLLLFRRKK